MKDPGVVTIYDPRTNPIRGLASQRSRTALPMEAGLYKDLSGVRWAASGGLLTVRPGITAYDSDPIAATRTPWGLVSRPVAGASGQAFAGLKDTTGDPHMTEIWWSGDMVGWDQLTVDGTSPSQRYGDTRLASESSSGFAIPLMAEVVRDRFNDCDVVVFQNGFDTPRVFDFETFRMAKHEPITAPTLGSKAQALYSFEHPLEVRDQTKWTAGGAGTNWSLTSTGADPLAYPSLSLTTAIPSSQKSLTFGTALDWSDSLAVTLGVRIPELALSHFINNVKITIVDSSITDTALIYDPSDGLLSAITVTTVDPTYSSSQAAASTPLSAFAPGSGTTGASSPIFLIQIPIDNLPGSVDLNSIKAISFDWITDAAAPDKAYLADLVLVAGSGNVPGGSTYEIAYFHSESRSESLAQALPSTTELFQALGSPSNVSVRVPFTRDLYYQVSLSFPNTDDSARDSGVDTLRAYRFDEGDDNAVYCSSIPLATWSTPSWSYASGTQSAIRTATENTASEDRLTWLTSPGGFQTCIPIARCMTVANTRLIVGAKESDQPGSPYSAVACSKPGNAFRFTTRGVDFFDPETAITESVPSEGVVALVASSASLLGSSSVYVLTDTSIWLMNSDAIGTRGFLTRVASVGTTSPLSVAENNGRVYFLDSDMRARRLSGNGLEVISLGFVDDKLGAIPTARRGLVSSAWFDFGYRLAYSSSESDLNDRMLVFSELAEAWESDDALPEVGPAEFLVTWRPGDSSVNDDIFRMIGYPRLVGLGADSILRRLEFGSDDMGDDIPVVIEPGDLTFDRWAGLHARNAGIVAEAEAATIDVLYTYLPNGQTVSSQIDLTSANPYRRVWNGPQTNTDSTLEANGIAVGIRYSGDLVSGKTIQALVLEIEGRDLAADAV